MGLLTVCMDGINDVGIILSRSIFAANRNCPAVLPVSDGLRLDNIGLKVLSINAGKVYRCGGDWIAPPPPSVTTTVVAPEWDALTSTEHSTVPF